MMPLLLYVLSKFMLGLYLNMPRVHGLLTTFLKYELKLYKRNLPSDFLGTRHYACKERLSRLDLDSLEMRRLQQDLLYTYKIVFNLVSRAANDMFTLANTLYSTRTVGHPYKLYLHNSFIDVRKHFSLNVLSLPGTICLRHQKTFLVFLHLNVLLTRLI